MQNRGKTRTVLSGAVCGLVALALAALALWRGGLPGGRHVVGQGIRAEAVTDFYYTYATSTFPPEYQRYRFYTEDGAYWFYHETREGERFPLEEEDVTLSGAKELSAEEWRAFFALLEGGSVRAREESLDSGDSGPWLYLYWNGDGGAYQEYHFPSWEALTAFEEFCAALRDA